MRFLLAIAALSVTAPPLARAQTTSPPFSCADTVEAALGAYRGTWHVQALFRSRGGTWDTTQATSTFTPDLSGCVLRQDYHGGRYGEAYSYLALWGANGLPDARIQRVFTHSLHGIIGLAAGGFRGDTLTLESRLVVQGRPLIQQVRLTRPQAGEFAQFDRRSTDGGVTWTETLRATYRRDAP
jgi:hypothetical protein